MAKFLPTDYARAVFLNPSPWIHLSLRKALDESASTRGKHVWCIALILFQIYIQSIFL